MADAPASLEPELITAEGLWGGPVYSYRGAEIRCAKGGHVCALFMDEHPLNGRTFCAVGTVTGMINCWLDGGRLPDHLHAVPKPGGT